MSNKRGQSKTAKELHKYMDHMTMTQVIQLEIILRKYVTHQEAFL